MSRYPDIYVSDLLSNEELRSAIEALPDVLRAMLGDASVTAVYGLGSNLHVDLWHLPMKVGTRWFDRFVQDSLRQEIVRPGDSDFRVTPGSIIASSHNLPTPSVLTRIRRLGCSDG